MLLILSLVRFPDETSGKLSWRIASWKEPGSTLTPCMSDHREHHVARIQAAIVPLSRDYTDIQPVERDSNWHPVRMSAASSNSDLSLRKTADRIQLYSTYFELHPGKLDMGTPCLVDLAQSSVAMTSALDTAALLYVGSTYQIDDCMTQAQRSYTTALGQLRLELCSDKTKPATIFGIMHIMETCELFKCTSASALTGWQQHADGNVSLMEEVLGSARLLETWHALSDSLTSSTRLPFTLWLGLARRKRLKAHEVFWSQCESQNIILPVAMTVPGELEAADVAMQASSNGDVCHSLVGLARKQQRLHEALENCDLGKDYPQFTLSTSEGFTTSLLQRSDIESLEGLSYFFSNLGAATTHLSYWICMLLLQIARIDLVNAKSTTLSSPFPNAARLIDDAHDYANHICKTMAYCTLAKHGFVGKMNVIGPLLFVSGWYRRQEDFSRVQWCESISLKLEDAGLISLVAAVTCSDFGC